MTEQDLLDAGFTKMHALHTDTQNGYDYYYYINNVCEGVVLVSNGSDELVNDRYHVYSFDIPLKIYSKEKLNEFISLVKHLITFENV